MNNFVKSIPMVGNKHKTLPQILPHLERSQFTRFVDIMAGSGVVAVNTNYKNILLNDSNFQMVEILSHLYRSPSAASIERIDAIINNSDFKIEFINNYSQGLIQKNPKHKSKLGKLFELFENEEDYVLTAKNKKAYLLLREIYNNWLNDPYVLLVLMYCSFNNMFRMNKRGGWNCPHGQRTFNDTARKNLVEFIEKLQSKTVAFMDWPIENWDWTTIKETDLIYFDPPYDQAGAAYNVIWDDTSSKTLLQILDHMTELGKFWGMSNVFQNNNKHNATLENWAKNYNVIYLDNDYSNSYYTRGKAKTVEVLIRNYD